MHTTMHSTEAENFGGHYLTSGAAVLGMGGIGLLASLFATLAPLPLGFIDRPAMVVTSIGLVAIGIWMRRTGRKAHGDAD